MLLNIYIYKNTPKKNIKIIQNTLSARAYLQLGFKNIHLPLILLYVSQEIMSNQVFDFFFIKFISQYMI